MCIRDRYETGEATQSQKEEMKKLELMDNNNNLFPIVKSVIKNFY